MKIALYAFFGIAYWHILRDYVVLAILPAQQPATAGANGSFFAILGVCLILVSQRTFFMM